MNLEQFERQVGIKRTTAPVPTRADADRIRRRMLSKKWRKVKARRR